MESPRGLNDPRLGAFAEVLRRADLIVLLGKALDFTLRFGDAPAIDPACRFIAHRSGGCADRARRGGQGRAAGLERHRGCRARRPSHRSARPAGAQSRHAPWAREVHDAIGYRPPAWATLTSREPGKVHPLEICRALQPHPRPATRVRSWSARAARSGNGRRSCCRPRRRIINGPAGSIGASIPFAIAARAADPEAPVIAVMGDGSFGFHMAEFDTAVRYGLPFVAVVGNDAGWNAEHQIQLREYGPNRTHGCELLPSALRPGRAGARRPRRARHQRRRARPGARARARQRQAGLRQRHDRARAGAGDPARIRIKV